jgi:hypothetical protein
MIAKCESAQGQKTQLSEFLLQNDRHNREQTWAIFQRDLRDPFVLLNEIHFRMKSLVVSDVLN